MSEIPTGTLLVGYCHRDRAEVRSFEDLADLLAARLGQPVVACALDQPDSPLLAGLATLLQQGAVKIVILPLFLSPAEYRDNPLTKAVTLASRRWPFVHFHLAPPPDWVDWTEVCSDLLILQNGRDDDKSSVLLVARGGANADINSETYKLTRLLYEAGDHASVDVAFVASASPDVPEMIERCRLLGAEQIILLPHLLLAGTAYMMATAFAEAANVAIGPPLSSSASLIEILLTRHAAASEDRSLLPVSWEKLERQLTAELNSHDRVVQGQPAPDEDDFIRLANKIDAILPPRYRGRAEKVSAASMAAADLAFNEAGDVAWNQIFGVDDPENPFCELALAGGPAHRGALLEPPLAEACAAEPGKQAAVLAEIARGIAMITGLPMVESKSPGWIGIRCDSDEMAIWMVRAIIVENVMVRREGAVLYLPAGPDFTLKDQIKSIVTVTAKTWHYWIEHSSYQTKPDTVSLASVIAADR